MKTLHSKASKTGFLNEVKRKKPLFYNLVLCHSAPVEASGSILVFQFNQKALVEQFVGARPWLVEIARKHFGDSCDVSAAWIH